MERTQYNESLKHHRDLQNSLSYAEKEGEKRGEKRGEKKHLLSVIKKALEGGIALDQISIFTGLSVKEIKEIIKKEDWNS